MAEGRRRPTMYDVARESGVSQATVSLVLNGVAGVRVAEPTRARIIEAAERLGYRRSSRVRADSRDPAAIGLIIDDLMASPFAAPLMEGAREAAWERQCVVEVISTRNHEPMEKAAIHRSAAARSRLSPPRAHGEVIWNHSRHSPVSRSIWVRM